MTGRAAFGADSGPLYDHSPPAKSTQDSDFRVLILRGDNNRILLATIALLLGC